MSQETNHRVQKLLMAVTNYEDFRKGLLDSKFTTNDVRGEVFRRRRHGLCVNCGKAVRVQIFKGGDWCSDDCRKAIVKGWNNESAASDK